MSKTKIDWCDEVWNPVTGCSKISEGCKNCYAEKMAARLQKMGLYKYRNGFKVECHDDEFEKHFPSKGKRIFVNSMSDLFHPEVPFDFVDSVFTEISKHNNRHVFIILTKRPERMKEYLTSDRSNHKFAGYMCWPLKNLWLGVSVETDRYAFRADHLRDTSAAIRFLSCEPLLGPLPSLDLSGITGSLSALNPATEPGQWTTTGHSGSSTRLTPLGAPCSLSSSAAASMQ